MLEERHFRRISRVLPFLQTGASQIVQDFNDFAYYIKIPAGKQVFTEGDEIDGIALLISGVVRVYKLGLTGREITLYRFGVGESCVITANAILNQTDFPAIAVVERDAEAVLIPADRFSDWVRRYDPWREFVFN